MISNIVDFASLLREAQCFLDAIGACDAHPYSAAGVKKLVLGGCLYLQSGAWERARKAKHFAAFANYATCGQ